MKLRNLKYPILKIYKVLSLKINYISKNNLHKIKILPITNVKVVFRNKIKYNNINNYYYPINFNLPNINQQ